MKSTKILVQGIVQGVGFRPFVYRIAIELKLNGFVRNLGNVVEIVLQGEDENINQFLVDLEEKKPPIAKINSIEKEIIDKDQEYEGFKIYESSDNFAGTSVIPPDVAICDNCLEEIRDPNNRRYHHPFNACTDCGPRFTVIENVPYDRDKTTMDDFPLCKDCEKEYKNPLDRRYHAEAMCCPVCGPELALFDSEGNDLKSEHPLHDTVKLLDEGNILSIKGIGGTHLVAKVTDEEVVNRLRNRLGRKSQPFAVMSPDIETALTFTEISKKEKETLKSKERPIVVLKKSKEYYFADSVAPYLHTIGVMLPYSPMHNLLFDFSNEPAYIMTSANIPGEPMMITNEEILGNLKGISDYSLIHNRRIINRCDDSVVRYRNDELSFIRRSRGYTPEPYDLNGKVNDKTVLALGPELDVTFTILKNNLAYVSQHIGNTNKYKTYLFLQDAIKNMMNITKTVDFDIIACDLHPQFFTTKLAKKLAEKYDAELVQVQHHHAHGVAMANDNDIDEMILIASDGVGYGDDGTAWGGEILYTDIGSYERLGSLMPQKMPGGDLCAKYPVRMLTSILEASGYYSHDELIDLLSENYVDYFPHGEMEIHNVLKQLDSNLNVGITSSTGRVLDSISSALGICGSRNYEGEAAMKLESAAIGAEGNIKIPIKIKKLNNLPVLDTSDILKEIMSLISEGADKKEIAYASQIAISEGLSEIAVRSAELKNVEYIGATGGTFYNEAITLNTKNYIENEGYNFIQHRNSCAGDGSVSLGQAIVAAYKK
jgi:hydrogenase maturation protein HypF